MSEEPKRWVLGEFWSPNGNRLQEIIDTSSEVGDCYTAPQNAGDYCCLLNSISTLTQRNAELESLLQTILDYRRGEGQFDFSSIPSNQRENVSFDAWNAIEEEISQALSNTGESE